MKTTFVATGDSFITRRIPEHYPGRDVLQELLMKHDVRFNNLEITCHEDAGYPAAFSGGTWAMADPAVLDDLKALGFNLFNTANNHASDFSQGGLLETIRNLKKRGLVYAGTGKNMAEASKAVYLDTAECRVALIGITSDFHDSDLAGEQGPVMAGRPGVNGMRVNRVCHVTEDYLGVLRSLVNETNMNSYEEYGVKLGYVNPAPADTLSMAGMRFCLDERNYIEEKPAKADLERTVLEIQEAGRQADYVMVSIHTHGGSYEDYANPPEFLEVFTRACIDAGADVILGHGPHELRAVEVYKGKPIFYSLGNFIFQTETVDRQPAEAYSNKGLPVTMKVGEYMDRRSDGGKRGYGILPPVWFSVIPSWTMENGTVTQIRLYPVTLGRGLPRSRRGFPRLTEDDGILEHLQKLSSIYGTRIEIQDHVGIIRL